MTGPLTIPFTAVAFYVTDDIARVIFGFLAVACVATSAYVIWRNERNARIIVEDKLDSLNAPSVSIALHQVAEEGLDGIQTIFLEVTGVGVEYIRPEVFATSVDGVGEGKRPILCTPDVPPPPFGVSRGETHNVAVVAYDIRQSIPLRVLLPCKKITSTEYPRGDYYRMRICAFAGPKEAELNIDVGMDDQALWARTVGSSMRLFSNVRTIARRGRP